MTVAALDVFNTIFPETFLFIEIQKNNGVYDRAFTDGSTDSKWMFTNNIVRFSLQKRRAYPKTYCKVTKAGRISAGYGEKSGEFLHISLSCNGYITIQRDEYATLPLYVRETNSYVYVSNRLDVVTEIEKCILINSRIVESVLQDLPVFNSIVEGLQNLSSGGQMKFDENGLHIKSYGVRNWILSKDVEPHNPQEFAAVFTNHLQRLVGNVIKNQVVAFEVSGGLDSATLVQFYARNYRNHKGIAGSIELLGQLKEIQSKKICVLLKDTNFEHISISPTSPLDTPLSRYLLDRKLGSPLGEKIYYNLTLKLINLFKQKGAEIVCTGMGGDELFGHVNTMKYDILSGQSEKERRSQMYIPEFFTNNAKKSFVESVKEEGTGPRYRALSVEHENLSYNIYIENGLWPVSPFASPSLYRWVTSIPYALKYNKKILRLYHQANQFAEEVYNAEPTADFRELYFLGFKDGTYKKLIEKYVRNGYLVKNGLLDIKKLESKCEQLGKRGVIYTETDETDAFYVYNLLQLEITLCGINV